MNHTSVRARHVVWDWNGTLLDDNEAVVHSVNAVLTAFDRAPLTIDAWRAAFTRPLTTCYERLLGRVLAPEDWARIDVLYHEAYRERLDECGLALGVPHLLRDWQNSGRTQSLLSMWFHEELVPLVGKLGLDGLFTRVDGLRGVNMGGSKTEHLAAHLSAMALDPAEVVLIGDVVDDAEAAAAAGAQCVLVSTGVMDRPRLEAAGVPVADSIPQALGLLGS
ncbi:HAD family hydrolase [Kutzneria albida]|uniref:Phosphatase n=1 Tax=Kutzneria albida DSM 43870 TaxID=1449976 RepID=W5WH27_9PSEU|nr:HAD family hydrolase [Kutzneria albida]AHI00056.1 hypothetical protein KALB_6697 [Kutzneria albida DSM 43870]